MLGRLLGLYIIYSFGGSCPLTELCPVQNSLCVEVLRFSILAAFCTTFENWAWAKLCGMVQGMELRTHRGRSRCKHRLYSFRQFWATMQTQTTSRHYERQLTFQRRCTWLTTTVHALQSVELATAIRCEEDTAALSLATASTAPAAVTPLLILQPNQLRHETWNSMEGWYCTGSMSRNSDVQ